MIYLNYLQAELLPDRANRKVPVIVNNLSPRCNNTSRKKAEHALLCITSRLRVHPHITGNPSKCCCSNTHRLNPRISGDPPQNIFPSPVHTPTE